MESRSENRILLREATPRKCASAARNVRKAGTSHADRMRKLLRITLVRFLTMLMPI